MAVLLKLCFFVENRFCFVHVLLDLFCCVISASSLHEAAWFRTNLLTVRILCSSAAVLEPTNKIK